MANINLSWIVKLVILMVVIGVALGVSVYRNLDAKAIDTSAPGAAATLPAGAAQPGPAAQPAGRGASNRLGCD